jgi:hypothetical protein
MGYGIEGDAAACMRRHQAFALAPVREHETLPLVLRGHQAFALAPVRDRDASAFIDSVRETLPRVYMYTEEPGFGLGHRSLGIGAETAHKTNIFARPSGLSIIQFQLEFSRCFSESSFENIRCCLS